MQKNTTTAARKLLKRNFVKKHIDLFMQIPMFPVNNRYKHRIVKELANIARTEIGYAPTVGDKDIFIRIEIAYKEHLINIIK